MITLWQSSKVEWVWLSAVQEALHGYSEVSETVLEASLCPQLNYEQVYRLFDIIPGLDICNYDHATGPTACLSVCLCVSTVCLTSYQDWTSATTTTLQVLPPVCLSVCLCVSTVCLTSYQGWTSATTTTLQVLPPVCLSVARDKLNRFEYPPGYSMSVCVVCMSVGKACVKYLNPHSAAYARDKLNRFEYPPGYSMSVQFLTRWLPLPASLSRSVSVSMSLCVIAGEWCDKLHNKTQIDWLIDSISIAWML